MIPITKAERPEILKLFPAAEIHATKRHIYLVTSRDAIEALNEIRHTKPFSVHHSNDKRHDRPRV